MSHRVSVSALLDQASIIDPGLTAVIDVCGYPKARVRQANFATLAEIIVSQQLSTKAADAIWRRLKAACSGHVSSRRIALLSDADLNGCGLSRAKVGYLRGLSDAVIGRQFSFKVIQEMSTEDAVKALIALKGIGVWSAEIFCMFALRHQDIFPAGDLALQVALQRYFNHPQRPDSSATRQLAQRWTPYRSAVALLMWRYYGATTLD